MGIECLVYHEDSATKMNSGDLMDKKKDFKVVWLKPCIRIIEIYINLVLTQVVKPNLYLLSL